MSSLADLPELVGFFSYSRSYDEYSDTQMSLLRKRIVTELRLQLGRDLQVWQDAQAIPSGTLWESEIKKAITESTFFIPIVTPRAVNSDFWRMELLTFLARESELQRNDLIFPILYIRVPALTNEDQRGQDEVLRIISARQYADWTKIRLDDVASHNVRMQIARLCEAIVEALHKPWESRRRSSGEEEEAEDQGPVSAKFEASAGASSTRLFICYKREDQSYAFAVRQWLIEVQGWRAEDIFVDVDRLRLGGEWEKKLLAEAEAAEVMLFLASDQSLDIRSFCYRELQQARGQIIAVTITGVAPDDKRLQFAINPHRARSRLMPPLDNEPTRPFPFVSPIDNTSGSARLNPFEVENLGRALHELGIGPGGAFWTAAEDGSHESANVFPPNLNIPRASPDELSRHRAARPAETIVIERAPKGMWVPLEREPRQFPLASKPSTAWAIILLLLVAAVFALAIAPT
jgi:hypothetical protein